MSLRVTKPSLSIDQNQPSTIPSPLPPPPPQSVLSTAFQNAAHLANLLPTGTLLAFQLLTPIFTNNGSCDTVTRPLTLILLVLLSLSCFLASFTDSIKAADGHVYYGFATFKGLWLFHNTANNSLMLPKDMSKYKLSFMDVVHAVLSVLVFVVVGLRDKNVVRCFYPMPGREAQQVLDVVPMAIGIACSLLFVLFPTKRHGIGYPVTRDQ